MIFISKFDLIDELSLSTRSYNALRRNQIHTIDDLIKKQNILPEIKQLGHKSLSEINDILGKIVVVDNIISDFSNEKIVDNSQSNSKLATIIKNKLQNFDFYGKLFKCGIKNIHQFLNTPNSKLIEYNIFSKKDLQELRELKNSFILSSKSSFCFEENTEKYSYLITCRIIQDLNKLIEVEPSELYDEIHNLLSSNEYRNINALSEIKSNQKLSADLSNLPNFRAALKKMIIFILKHKQNKIIGEEINKFIPYYMQNSELLNNLLTEMLDKSELIAVTNVFFTVSGDEAQALENSEDIINIKNYKLPQELNDLLIDFGIENILNLLETTPSMLQEIIKLNVNELYLIKHLKDSFILSPIYRCNNKDILFNYPYQISCQIIQDLNKLIEVDASELYYEIHKLLSSDEYCYVNKASEINSNNNLLYDLFSLPILSVTLKNIILSMVEQNKCGVKLIKIKEILPYYMQNNDILIKFLNEMIAEKIIMNLSEDSFIIAIPTINQYISTIDNANHAKILEMRMSGATLEHIGGKFNFTRERVRQIVSKLLPKIPDVFEDIYADVFKKYKIQKDEFILGFGVSEFCYNYLALKYKNGSLCINDLVKDKSFPYEFRLAGDKIVHKNHVTINGERVLCNKSDLTKFIIRTYGKDGISYKEFCDQYLKLLEELNLNDNPKFYLKGRSYENTIANSANVLCRYGKTYRYYNICSYNLDELLSTLDLNKYSNIEISAKKIFVENLDLMHEYDIRDEYELHNLLKKCAKLNNIQISVSRRCLILNLVKLIETIRFMNYLWLIHQYPIQILLIYTRVSMVFLVAQYLQTT